VKNLTHIQSLIKAVRRAQQRGTIGFVPTMGAFHAGHLSLMQKAKAECDAVIVSIFVNPLQFGPGEDFKIYPRTLSEDRKKAASTGVTLLWTPSEKTLFPAGFQTRIEMGEITQRWEGATRPDHFSGVATIVAKLLQIIRPDRLYLGQKDYQQCCVIRQMMADLHFKTKLRRCPIVREKDGLAMSSRNVRLSNAERDIAPLLYQALLRAKTLVRQGECRATKILRAAADLLNAAPQIEIDYLALCDVKTLVPLTQLKSRAVLLAAVKLGALRLIDNILLQKPTPHFSKRPKKNSLLRG